MIITVDGLAASGKGTLSKALGAKLSLPTLDTGALWRILAFQLTAEGYHVDVSYEVLEDAAITKLRKGLDLSLQDAPEIRTETLGNFASVVSCNSYLRRLVNEQIEDWLARNKGGILDGRDCGIANAPHADHKFFLIADPLVRASRRASQLGIQVVTMDGAPLGEAFSRIHASIVERDKREIHRKAGAARPATDAVIIDTTYTSPRAGLETALSKIAALQAWDALVLETARL